MIISLPPVDDHDALVGERLRAVRQARGLTARQLASEAAVSPGRLALAEHGRTRLTSAELHGLINALHIPLDLLFTPGLDVTGLRRL